MADEDSKMQGNAVVRIENKPPAKVPLGPTTEIDLSGLSEAERSVLLRNYSEGMLGINKKAHELGVDVEALGATLIKLANTTDQLSQQGNSVTITHTQDTTLGRTEISMGNTDAARSGKLTRSQAGERDLTPYYIGAGLLALVLIAALIGGS